MNRDGDNCFWCGVTRWCEPLEEHHVWRRSQGGKMKGTVLLCAKCHRDATDDKDFEKVIQDIYDRETSDNQDDY